MEWYTSCHLKAWQKTIQQVAQNVKLCLQQYNTHIHKLYVQLQAAGDVFPVCTVRLWSSLERKH